MKIYTKSGDAGKTSLIGGTRVPKYDIRIESYGTVDELSAWIGLIRDQDIGWEISTNLVDIQSKLFTIESMLACEGEPSKLKIPEIASEDIIFLEDEIDNMNNKLPILKSFVISGGSTTISYCHIARTICRRAERLVVQLNEQYIVNELILMYLNRLSDYLFVLARKIGNDKHIVETLWKPTS